MRNIFQRFNSTTLIFWWFSCVLVHHLTLLAIAILSVICTKMVSERTEAETTAKQTQINPHWSNESVWSIGRNRLSKVYLESNPRPALFDRNLFHLSKQPWAQRRTSRPMLAQIEARQGALLMLQLTLPTALKHNTAVLREKATLFPLLLLVCADPWRICASLKGCSSRKQS